ncbi:MAG: GNAT family N-acetyltransferase [Lactobacillales bacterium]|jgi:ribosomal-protein-alanine N-acetyltransferase|nr:GNAT family N-acetyltransferase [Lactobacillales bacterium]
MLPCAHRTAYAPVLEALHRASFDKPWHIQEFTDILKLPTTLLWVVKEGFLLCGRVTDEMEILTICVLPQDRRKGIADTLIKKMIAYAHDHGIIRIFLEVSKENVAAQRLYKKNGFVLSGERRDYYQTPTGKKDAWCFTWQMPVKGEMP